MPRAEGYDSADVPHAPYHGYFYKVLTRQGAEAPGGARDYIAGGHMTAGFALIAFPAKYGDSGVMTFVVNQAGIVFEKDLGPNTASVATAIAESIPMPHGRRVEVSIYSQQTFYTQQTLALAMG